MTQKIIALILTIFVSFSVFSQNTIKTTVSDLIEHEANFSKARGGYFQSSTLVSDNLGGYFMVKMNAKGAPIQKPKSYSIYHYDENLKLISNTEYEINRNSAFLGGAFVDDGKISLVQRVKSKTDNKNYDFEVITSIFDSNEFEKNLLLSHPQKEKFYKFPQDESLISDSIPTGIFVSKNNNFFSIIKKKSEKNNSTFVINTFDKSLKKIYENKFNLEEKDFNVASIKINDENGAIIANCYTKKGKKITTSKILKIDKNEVLELKIPSENLYGYLHEISLSNDKFAIVSLASKIEEKTLGISISSYEKNGTLITSKFHKLPNKFIVDKYRKLKTLNPNNFTCRLNHIEVDSQDNIYFSGQEYTPPSTITMQNYMGSYSTFNFPAIYDDILIGKISFNEEFIYIKNIKNKTAKANFEIFNDQLYIFTKGTTNTISDVK